ncbi:MAG: YbhB/YbcL family Raf kinase inhibitor-like protein [Lentilactobacillus hilgardii]|jgi:Raf kinase inhibitor-like YbhB/YbcL family protein|uniref:YbhB/YbcL family Raf kinase inhibitor-like protein n=1 Tax=Lentilactobacillus hilgardii TaxID=1588 RepID=A0A6P1EB62_LENHI|nr:YbhB/YbcL family Raf kinase inhibitor-like protein [Lentilactobacillus hilgardii]MCI2018649.1 YbhB/YbcL family Raf kinase inhibitor-like protein [Lentilactobacillus buchneri]RRG12606.1 MAG: YbhB/YbcL family Raf kinase inhibitor-like protein [Lactobacillus sp.]EEI70712.1 Raf-like protein [Lentilactobacillus hilgardii ATCC 27305]MBZ2200261.1 YbhB/YbcL family Raf kinase inhibitor-like protein [Lentilactobacillus hilgardii]MBZ2203385.1 YbhB/YbcL family Raf kinase inhibitor-like protein [Lentila
MDIKVPLTKGFLPDKYAKHTAPANIANGSPIISFPIQITGVPKEAKSLALTLIDWDAVPVSGFPWIHWIAANISPDVLEIPEDNSRNLTVPMVQGRNSTAGGLVGNNDPDTAWHYNGPNPPDKVHNYHLSVFALDSELPLKNGFWLNELQDAMRGHILDTAEIVLPSQN